ncbi:tRNA-histidine guanylyltransferase 1-like [Dimargaris xerosporica]|nr:tRNA-histidine guanylyltransferase 1-like [Dimargaris xerosporica]
MANSKYEYVRQFERETFLLPNTWLVVRIDGQGFHKYPRFSDKHQFEKPNDARALNLMNYCAKAVFDAVADIRFAYGESDEYSFVLDKKTKYYNRRESKLASSIVSMFTSHYVYNWSKYFPDKPLKYPPSFDSRVVCYPSYQNLRDYLSWRQADCHINNLYNTTFWALVKSGRTETQAEADLKGTLSADKNELLFSQFNINYNSLPAMYRKGSIIVRDFVELEAANAKRPAVRRKKTVILHEDIIGDKFWKARPFILGE